VSEDRTLETSRLARRIATITLLGCGVLLLPACAAAVVGGAAYGAFKAVNNEHERDFATDLESTWQAAIGSLQENGHPVAATATHGATSGTLEVGDVEVRVASHAGGKTRVSIRIGTFDTDDHRRRARLIMDGIARRLGA
jgi:hypothetical protein